VCRQPGVEHVSLPPLASEKGARRDDVPGTRELNRAPRFLFSHYNQIVLFLATM
jgi:hypothetical protein